MNSEGFAEANGLRQIPKNETEKGKHGDILREGASPWRMSHTLVKSRET
jgi:hypothetical protein